MECLEIKEFPVAITRPVHVTGMMREVISRTLAVFGHGTFVVFCGEAGVGKTTTANELRRALDRAFKHEDPNAFRAIYLEVGRVPVGQGHEAKRAIRSLYTAAGAVLDEGIYNRYPPEELAAEFIEFIKMRRIKMIFVDEAGLLSIEAIGGLVTVLDVSRHMEHPLTIVLIGMDDLPIKIRRRPQINRRVFEWCTFTPYGFDDTVRMLRVMHPHFAALDLENPEHRAQFDFVHEASNGLPGFMSCFIERLDYRLQGRIGEITPTFLRTIHLLTVESMEKAMELAQHGYSQEEDTVTKKRKRNAKGKGGAKNHAV